MEVRYNVNTILAERIGSILARNVTNTRARDFYDLYILLTLRKNDVVIGELQKAIWKKEDERNMIAYVENLFKYLQDIAEGSELREIWNANKGKYPYADGTLFEEVIMILKVFLN